MSFRTFIKVYIVIVCAVDWCVLASNNGIRLNRCPQGWTSYRSVCLKVHHGRYSWHQGAATCEEYDAILVTINNEEKNNIVNGILPQQKWIGLRVASSKKFIFVWNKSRTSQTSEVGVCFVIHSLRGISVHS